MTKFITFIEYLLLIMLGYTLKRFGIFTYKDKNTLGKLLMYVMLPCAFIYNFSDFSKSKGIFCMVFIGFSINLLMAGIGYLISYKKNNNDKSLYVIECSGYNIGAFTIPFMADIFPAEAILMASFFDIGNSIMSIGGIFPLGKMVGNKSDNSKNLLNITKDFLSNLFKSIPFDTYIVMLFISLAGVKLPEGVNNITHAIGSCSVIITMIMIGIIFEVKIKREDVLDIVKILLVRYCIGYIIVFLICSLFKVPIFIQKILLICTMAPTTSISPNYCSMCKCKSSVYGAVSSFSVVISLIIFLLITLK